MKGKKHAYHSFSEIAISKQILFSIAFPLVGHTVPDCVLGIKAGDVAGYDESAISWACGSAGKLSFMILVVFFPLSSVFSDYTNFMAPLESSLNGSDKLIADGARNSADNLLNICMCLLETLT